MPIHTTLTDLFASQHLDGVMVATPNSLHVENGLDCAEHSVLVERSRSLTRWKRRYAWPKRLPPPTFHC